mmetsp:Transcript_34313/g.102552  ORF Transcript_34313/g.102552 Transcript_34313/m.102552 type:complete len:275 (-) Transcript_34313:285-1109(-)
MLSPREAELVVHICSQAAWLRRWVPALRISRCASCQNSKVPGPRGHGREVYNRAAADLNDHRGATRQGLAALRHRGDRCSAGGLHQHAMVRAQLDACGNRCRISCDKGSHPFGAELTATFEDRTAHPECPQGLCHRIDGGKRNEFPGSEALGHGGGPCGLAGNNPRRVQPANSLQTRENPHQQAPAADARDDRIWRPRELLRKLLNDGRVSLPRRGLVERVDVGAVLLLRDLSSTRVGLIPHAAVDQNFSTVPLEPAVHTRRRGGRQHDSAGHP